MAQSSVSVTSATAAYSSEAADRLERFSFTPSQGRRSVLAGVQRRWLRERRRRKVGRAYDMSLEIARFIPATSKVLDVGCGNGFIAHHLAAACEARVMGIDLDETTEAPIAYRQFAGRHFPVADGSMDVALLCYVLHHAQELEVVLGELKRVLRPGGRVIVYEDIPDGWWDRFLCWTHNLKWRKRTGPCTFRREAEWRSLFNSAGFEVVIGRRLSRWRNLSHPVRRQLYVLLSSV
ncbi:MAG TPA: class I SAM-dependent methyltransferase [Pyrinomonadaceae bacterium]|nr:class I SAM-dependent methyltransferase [Pyrinomonadaceae bacterium]